MSSSHFIQNSNKLLNTERSFIKPDPKSFSEYWEVQLYCGRTYEHPNGTYCLSITSIGRYKVENVYLLNSLGSEKLFNQVLEELSPFGRYIDRDMLNEIINHAEMLRINDEAKEQTTEELECMLKGACTTEKAIETYNQFIEDILENEKFSEYPTFSSKKYSPFQHEGIRIDDKKLMAKFGKDIIAVNKYTLMDLLVWDEDTVMSREEFMSKNQCKHTDDCLKKILLGWRKQGYLIKAAKSDNERKRLNEVIYNPYEGKNKERFYIIHCPKIYEAFKEKDKGCPKP